MIGMTAIDALAGRTRPRVYVRTCVKKTHNRAHASPLSKTAFHATPERTAKPFKCNFVLS